MIGKTISKKDDYTWSPDPEPHFSRRKAMLEKYPEIRQLFKKNAYVAFSSLILVFVQMSAAYYVNFLPWWLGLILSYVLGATIIQAIFLAIHELSHDLVFKSKKWNEMWAILINIPVVAPYAISFKRYHLLHHIEQGVHGVDTDIPSLLEAKLFQGVIGKAMWYCNQIFFYALRPIFVKPMGLSSMQLVNVGFQVIVMALVLPQIGWTGTGYLLLSIFFAGGLHPAAAHFISEHYISREGQETYSYYGILNKLTYNVGYHVEHHDFPRIPGRYLPQVKKIAPEFYDSLYSYPSWIGVMKMFVFSEYLTLFSRTKRKRLPKTKAYPAVK